MTGIGIESIECNISDGLSGTQVVRCLGVQKWFFAHRSIITSKLCGKTPLSVSIDIPRWMNSIRKQKLNANASQKSTQIKYTQKSNETDPKHSRASPHKPPNRTSTHLVKPSTP